MSLYNLGLPGGLQKVYPPQKKVELNRSGISSTLSFHIDFAFERRI